MATPYGLSNNINITYGQSGFPPWVYKLCSRFGLKASTYPFHQSDDRPDIKAAPNPQGLNRGIDWVGEPQAMLDFARWLRDTQPPGLEMVIYQDPCTGEQVGFPTWVNYNDDYPSHTTHIHTRIAADPIEATVGSGGNDATATPTAVGWIGDPVWLEEVLRPVLGDKLKALPDWQEYGHGDFGDIWGVMLHHTGNANEPAQSIRDGRPDLAGPLANLHIAQDGTVTIVAAGVCWHAGAGCYPGLPTDDANQVVIGIECAWPKNCSVPESEMCKECWPDAEIVAMRDTVGAVLTKLGHDSSHVIGHKEWAGDENPLHEFRQGPHAKWDPGNIDMNWFRQEVAKAMRGDFKKIEHMNEPEQAPQRSDRELLEEIWRTVTAGATPPVTDRETLEDILNALQKSSAVKRSPKKASPKKSAAKNSGAKKSAAHMAAGKEG